MKKFRTRGALFAAIAIAIIAAVGTSAVFLHVGTSHAAATGTTLQSATKTGTSTFTSTSSGLLDDTLTQALPEDNEADLNTHTGNVNAQAPKTNPSPVGQSVTTNNPGFTGFQGLDHFDTRTRDGGNAFSLEPPDQGLCTDGNKVLEAVNDVLVVFDTAGHRLTTPISANTFFGLPFAINRTTGVRGDFLSDPKCYFDAATNRWFLTVLQEDAAPSVRAHTLLAVTQTGDPTGTWNRYSIDATDDGLNGTPSHAGCPCFGDQPLIGADTYGFYFSTNEFGNGFNGAQIYAISKSALASGALTPTVVHIDAGAIATPDTGGIWYSVQPATSPSASDFDTTHGGTEYFLSALQFGPAPLDNRIATWAMTNTSSLNNVTPSLNLLNTVIGSETYGGPAKGEFSVTQKSGSTPLGDSVKNHPQNRLNANDDRMNQVVYAQGKLYSGVNTVVGDASHTGIAYFIVAPHVSSTVSASIVKQGYVTVSSDNVIFPSIGVNSSGQGVMTFTLTGPNFYPTSAYTTLDATNGAGAVHIAGAGVGPADGFTGYIAIVGVAEPERWGDYSAATAAPDGSIWFASEYIAQSCTDAQFATDTTCGGTRTLNANWSTFVGRVQP